MRDGANEGASASRRKIGPPRKAWEGPFQVASKVSRMSSAAFLTLLTVATPAGAQMAESYALPLPHDPARWAEAASLIRQRGLSCPEVKSMAVVGHDSGGDNYRVDCGPVHGPADPTMKFRMRSGGEPGSRVEPWN